MRPMAAVFGCLHARSGDPMLLAAQMAAVGDCETVAVPGGILGGRAHPPWQWLHAQDAGGWALVDGEASFYHAAAGQPGAICRRGADGPRLALPHAGNCVLFEPAPARCHLLSDWTGAFPLYYALRDGGVVFSSHLRPLARAIGAPVDPVGVAEYVVFEFTLGARTMFRGVSRLLPGQVVSVDLDRGAVRVDETSLLGTEQPAEPGRDDDDAIDRLWETWLRALAARAIPEDRRLGLMMSAGWDSRLILGGLMSQGEIGRIVTYTHGDPASRELRLVERIQRRVGGTGRTAPLGPAMYDPAVLEECFRRSEQALFPHWYEAAKQLQADGARSLWSGVFAEILSGIYTPGFVLNGVAKLRSVSRSLAGGGESITVGRDGMRAYLEGGLAKRPRALSAEFWAAVRERRDELEADVEVTLARFERRGVPTDSRFAEAFLCEMRATNYLMAQVLTGRAVMDVGLPFADPELRTLATRIPIDRRFRNRLHRRMLLRHRPELLRFSTAGTMLDASAPLALQELSRMVRVALDFPRWRLYFATAGRIEPPRRTWYNFEFLRADRSLDALVGELRSPIWDRAALERLLERQRTFDLQRPVYPDSFLKPFGVDLMLRPH